MDIVILCGHPDSSYAQEILQALNARGLHRINVVAAIGNHSPRTWKSLWRVYGWQLPYVALRWLGRRFVQQLGRMWRGSQASQDSLETKVQTQGGRYTQVQEINGAECRQFLQALQVDLMILAGAPIVRAPILEVPRIGTLNVHQGALPQFRGMNVIEWAVLEGHPPTISVHFVDAGVDTGDVIVTELVPLQPGDTLDLIRRRASVQQIDLLAHTVGEALTGALPRRPQRPEEGRQYFVMHPRLRMVAERLLQRRLLSLAKV